MLKQNPRKKVTEKPTSKPKINLGNIENAQTCCFNTKGYFSSEEPYAEDYLKAKQDVFNKYRNKDNELVFIDPLKKTSPFIQRGMLKPITSNNNEPPNSDRILNNFLKNYINRKEKKGVQEEQKFFGRRRQSLGPSNIEINPSISTAKMSRPSTKSVFSRVSTTRSVCSSNKEN